MKTFLFFCCSAALLLAGCERYDGPTRVEGQVVDRHTGQAVGGATVQLVGVASGLGAGGTSPGNTFVTDAQGRFAFSFEASTKQSYTLFASTPSGYASDFDAPLLKGGHENTGVVIMAAAPAWVRVLCVDDLPLAKAGLYTSGYNGSGENQNVGPGNSSFVRPVQSNKRDSVYWEIITAQARITKGKIPYTAASFDTAMVTIHF